MRYLSSLSAATTIRHPTTTRALLGMYDEFIPTSGQPNAEGTAKAHAVDSSARQLPPLTGRVIIQVQDVVHGRIWSVRSVEVAPSSDACCSLNCRRRRGKNTTPARGDAMRFLAAPGTPSRWRRWVA
jgi:hypothetical protein